MLLKRLLHKYQRILIKILKRKRRFAVWAKMGGGKTITTLTAIVELQDDGKAKKPLIIAPLRVANTVWRQEAAKWAHTSHLRVSVATGGEKDRRLALHKKADIYVINRENIDWLVEYWGVDDWPYDMVVIDESSSFKNPDSVRFKFMCQVLPKIDRVIELTASPAAQGYIDLWAQFFLLDHGSRLGRTITAYRNRWFDKNPYAYKYELKEGMQKEIDERIDDLTAVVESYKGMPPVSYVNQIVPWTKKTRKEYEKFERDMIMSVYDELGEEGFIEACSKGVLTNKLLQFCQGTIYDEDREVHKIHDLKMKALKELREELQGQNLIICYAFRPDIKRLQKAFPKGVLMDEEGRAVEQWNAGKISELFVHPASAGHGLNLQEGGHNVVWYGMTWSLELYEQLNARVARQGQKNPCVIHHLLMENSMDEIVIKALKNKDKTQQSIIQAIRQKLKGE